MTMFMKNLSCFAPGTPVSLFSPLSDYSFSVSIGECSLLPMVGAEATCILFCRLFFLSSPNAHSHTHDPKGISPLL